MTDFNYKKYSLENLENWLHDAMSAGEATPHEIYDVIVGVVKENYYHHKHHLNQAYELLSLLNSGIDNNKYQNYLDKVLSCDKDDPSSECQGAWNDFWADDTGELPPYQSYIGWQNMSEDKFNEVFSFSEGKVQKWVLPIQVDGLTGDCYISLPDDLLEQVEWKEGDQVEWVDNKNGTFELRKVEK